MHINRSKTKQIFFPFSLFLVTFLFLLGGILLFFNKFNYKNSSLASISDSISIQTEEDINNLPQRNWDIEDPNIQAESVIVLEYNKSAADKILFNQNSKIKLPIASLVKLMTSMVVLDNYNLYQTITISEKSDSQALVLEDVKLGDTATVQNFLNIMLVASSNKSAYALSEVIGEDKFVGLMNLKSKEIGLKNTLFKDSTGMSGENYSTSEDLAALVKHIIEKYPKISEITQLSQIEIPDIGKFSNTNELLNKIPGILLGKTGFTKEAKGCLVLIINNNKNNDYLIYLILGSDDRFSAMQNLINWVNLAYTW